METTSRLRPNLFLGISFIEGAAVMVVELLGAKIIAPFYGTSLYVWASVLGVTLGALAFGYYFGGYLSKKYNCVNALGIILAISGVFSIIMPNLAPVIMNNLSSLGVRAGSAISVLSFLFIPVAGMGMVSPLITQLVNNNSNKAGYSTGKVYAISTLGGIIATFLSGFYFIPKWGISITAISIGSVLLLLSAIVFYLNKKGSGSLGVLLTLVIVLFLSKKDSNYDADTIIRYQSSGILGEWTVIDQLAAIDQGDKLYTRHLLLNWVDQTYTQASNPPLSLWNYPHRLSALAGVKPEGSKALLLGMGGGSISHNLKKLNFEVDIIELDNRVPIIAQKWFNFNPEDQNVIIDDARHFIRNTDKKYDLVILDMLNGEEQPAHVFTIEGIKEVKALLNPEGLVILNFQGLIDERNLQFSKAPRSVYKTFVEAGFNMKVCKQFVEGKPELSDDILMYGGPGVLKVQETLAKNIRYNKIYPFKQFHFNAEDLSVFDNITVKDAIVLTDDKMSLNILNNTTVLNWRKKKIKQTLKGIIAKGLPIYN